MADELSHLCLMSTSWTDILSWHVSVTCVQMTPVSLSMTRHQPLCSVPTADKLTVVISTIITLWFLQVAVLCTCTYSRPCMSVVGTFNSSGWCYLYDMMHIQQQRLMLLVWHDVKKLLIKVEMRLFQAIYPITTTYFVQSKPVAVFTVKSCHCHLYFLWKP